MGSTETALRTTTARRRCGVGMEEKRDCGSEKSRIGDGEEGVGWEKV